MAEEKTKTGLGPEEVEEGAGAETLESYMSGTREERIRKWLSPAKYSDGRLKSGDWMDSLLSHISLHSISPSGPHPSATFLFTVQPQHCNRLQNLHGGCAATLFDFCTTMPLTLINRPGFWAYLGVSRTLNVTYLRPIRVGEVVLVECEIVQVGRRLCTLKGTMRRKSDGLVMATCEHGKFNTDPPVQNSKGAKESKL